MDLDTLLEDFEMFDDWRERYQYLIDLGRSLPPMEAGHKTEANLVKGCQSQVWLTARQDEQGHIQLQADSDSAIVKGLCAVILALYSGKTPQELGQIEVEDIFERMGLHQHLSPNRRSGFFSMVQRVQALAA